MKRISIRERLILVYLIISGVSILGVGGLSYFVSRQALTERTFAQLTSLKTVKKRQIAQFFEDRNNDITLLAASGEVARQLDNLNPTSFKYIHILNTSVHDGNAESNDYFSRYLRTHRYYRRLIIGDTSGSLVVMELKSGDSAIHVLKPVPVDQNLKDLFRKLKEKPSLPVIQDFSPQDTLSAPDFILATSIIKNKQLTGFVAVRINLETLDAIMLERDPAIGLGKTGESYLVGEDGFLRSSSRFKDHHLLKTSVNTEGVKHAFLQGDGTDIYEDYRGIQVLGSYGKANIPGFNWVILAEIDLPEAFAPIYDLRSKILFLSILMAVMVFLLTLVIAGRITRPLGRLQHAARSLGEGNFEIVKALETHDEIQELTETFNQMTDKLKHQQEELSDQQLKRSLAMIDGQEMERQRLSRELHDGLGQSLVALKMRLESAIGANPEQTQLKLSEATREVNSTIQEIRRMSNDLMPAVLKEFGLITALRNLCNESSGNSKVNFIFQHIPFDNKLSDKLQTYLFRIVQEASTNIIKHAEAANAKITIEIRDNHIRLEIEDDGQGIHTDRLGKASGSGLIHIRERVNLLKGLMEISSIPGKGTIIAIQIPLNPENYE